MIKKNYVIESTDFNASHIDPGIKKDFIIYRFSEYKTKKAFDFKNLREKLEEKGVKVTGQAPHIVHVIRSSKDDLLALKQQIRQYYEQHYPGINVKDVKLFVQAVSGGINKAYTLQFKNSAHLYASSNVQLISEGSKQRLFVPYEIMATIKVFKASHNINRGTILKQNDITLSEVDFTRLKGKLFKMDDSGDQRAIKRIPNGEVVYDHDIERLPEIVKGTMIYAQIISGLVHLEFQAKALSDGRRGEYIYVEKSDGKRLKAKVIEKNRVEVK